MRGKSIFVAAYSSRSDRVFATGLLCSFAFGAYAHLLKLRAIWSIFLGTFAPPEKFSNGENLSIASVVAWLGMLYGTTALRSRWCRPAGRRPLRRK
jgi:hypothetical protein